MFYLFLAYLVQIQIFDEVGTVSDAIDLYINTICIVHHRLNLASLWWAIHMRTSMLFLGTLENGLKDTMLSLYLVNINKCLCCSHA